MARIKVESVLESLDYDLTQALARAVARVVPGAKFDQHALYRTFCQEAYQQCSTWENVPDRYVEK